MPGRSASSSTAAACPDDEAAWIADACTYGAIDLAAAATAETLEVGAVVLATGWQPYPMAKLPELGGGPAGRDRQRRDGAPRLPGRADRRQDPPPVRRERRRRGWPSSSAPGRATSTTCPTAPAVCCLASLKQATYVQGPAPRRRGDDVLHRPPRRPAATRTCSSRSPRREGVRLVKGKVGKIEQHDGALKLRVEDVEAERILDASADLVVLATGMMPNAAGDDLPLFDAQGRGRLRCSTTPAPVITVAGVARRPEDVAASVRDATGAAAARRWRPRQGGRDGQGRRFPVQRLRHRRRRRRSRRWPRPPRGPARPSTLTHACCCAEEGLAGDPRRRGRQRAQRTA